LLHPSTLTRGGSSHTGQAPLRQPQQRPQTPSLPHPPKLPAFFNQQRRPALRAAAPASSSSSSTDAVPHKQDPYLKRRRRRCKPKEGSAVKQI
jgi:hypothetical protein